MMYANTEKKNDDYSDEADKEIKKKMQELPIRITRMIRIEMMVNP